MSATEFKESFRHLLELRIKKDEDDAAAKKSAKAYKDYMLELYAELEEAGIRGRLEFDFGSDLGVAKFQRAATTYGTVIDRDTAIASLKAAGRHDAVFQEAVAEGRLNELVRDLLESKADLPDGVASYDRKRITVSRGRD